MALLDDGHEKSSREFRLDQRRGPPAEVPVRIEATGHEGISVHPMVLTEEQELLEQLQTRAPSRRRRCITMPVLIL